MEHVFEFGKTTESDAFFDRNPKFYPAFERLMMLTNTCFGRTSQFQNRAEDICFNLGEACRDDFMEILLLATQGFGKGASKLLRGLYERAVALAYIVKHPKKAERFVRYAAVQEYKAMNAALKIVSEEEFDAMMGPTNTAAKIRKAYATVKPEFQTTVCDKCKRQGTAFSWDIDVASMVYKVGDAFDRYYVGAYTIPNLNLHATLASTVRKDDKDSPAQRTKQRHADAEFALLNAMLILILVIRCQNTLFGLGLDAELSACEEDVWLGFGHPTNMKC